MRLRFSHTHPGRVFPSANFPHPHLVQHHHAHLRLRSRIFCNNSDSSSCDIQVLPIFPLGMVALPNADIPLQIFEARYRVLFHTLLSGGDGITPELVQNDSPFKGSKKFGMCYVNNQGLATYGTVLEIMQHQVLPDGRLLVMTKGRDRFKVKNIQQENPVLLCNVEMLSDEILDDMDLETLEKKAEKAKELFKNVLRLNAKYKKMSVKEEHLDPPELRTMSACQVPFWVASMLAGSPEGQQKVLEIASPEDRLDYIITILDEAFKHTSAALAIENVFSSPTADSTDSDDSVTTQADTPDEPETPDKSGKPKGPAK